MLIPRESQYNTPNSEMGAAQTITERFSVAYLLSTRRDATSDQRQLLLLLLTAVFAFRAGMVAPGTRRRGRPRIYENDEQKRAAKSKQQKEAYHRERGIVKPDSLAVAQPFPIGMVLWSDQS